MGSFKWQSTKVSDTWQKCATGDRGSSCTTLICCLSVAGLFYPFQSTMAFLLLLLFLCTLTLLGLLLQCLRLQLVASFPILLIFFTSCKVMSSLGLSFTCLGAKVWKWKVQREVQMKEGGALNGGDERSWNACSQVNEGNASLKVSPVLQGLVRGESQHTCY